MIDLIALGIDLGVRADRREIAIPSIAFVKKCEEYIAANPEYRHAPL